MTPNKPASQPGKSVHIANAKGGCGKSTVAVTLCGALAAAGQRVQLVDLDPQGSALTWAGLRAKQGREPAFDVRSSPATGYDWTVYDHPPGLPQKVNTQAQAHVVIVPTLLSMQDYTATTRFIQELEKAGTTFMVLPNRVERVSSDQSSMLSQLFDGQPFLPKRVGFQQALNAGVTVYDERSGVAMAPSVRQDFDPVVEALLDLLAGGPQRRYDSAGRPKPAEIAASPLRQ